MAAAAESQVVQQDESFEMKPFWMKLVSNVNVRLNVIRIFAVKYVFYVELEIFVVKFIFFPRMNIDLLVVAAYN